nr:hypothetical protein [Tanacetum cinerariifolium]
MELVLKQTRQGTSHEVLVSDEGVEELKRKVKIKGEKKEAFLTIKAETGSIHLLLETLSCCLKDSILQAGNPVKEILFKLNLPDHRSILTDSKIYIKMDMERRIVKVKELQERCIIKAFQVIKSRKLIEVAGSDCLQNKMKIVFTRTHSEDECFIRIVCDLCCGLRLSLSKNQRLITELEALGQRADVVRSLGYFREMVGRDSKTLGVLEQLLACAELMGVWISSPVIFEVVLFKLDFWENGDCVTLVYVVGVFPSHGFKGVDTDGCLHNLFPEGRGASCTTSIVIEPALSTTASRRISFQQVKLSKSNFPLLSQRDAPAEEVCIADEVKKRRNDIKARTTLLLALPDEHQLRFSKYKTAQELWAAILKTFCGNEATKNTKKNQLKQQYGNFKAEGTETLKQTFNRLQAIVSHLEFIDVEIKQDDLNQKFLTSLALKWLMYTIVWRNKNDLDTMSLDDLYNHLKVYEPKVQKKSESNSHNMAFISLAKNSSGKGEVNTATSQSNGSQIKYEDINQIDEDDIEKMDIKWNMSLLSMRADRFWKKTGKKITIQGTDVASFDKSKVECFNCHKMGHFARECRAPRSQDRGWDWSYIENEEENHALVANEEAPIEFALMAKSSSENEIRGLEFNVESMNNRIERLTNELEELKKEKEGLDSKLTGFQSAFKDLDTLLGSHRSDKNKEGLGYSTFSSVSENGESSKSIMSKPMIKFVKATDSPTEVKTNKVETVRKPSVKYAKMYRNTIKSPKVRGNKRNWNNLKTQQLGKEFVMKNKACFKCRQFDHLAYDCGVWVEQGKAWSENNYTHKSRSPITVFYKTDRTPAAGNSQNNIDDKGYWNSGCSRHMTGNISYLSKYEPYDGGYMSFGQGGCKITGKGTIKTGKLEFENVYLFKDLKYNMFSMSQICDNKNSVLFTDSECIVLGRNFKLKDDSNVLLRTLR